MRLQPTTVKLNRNDSSHSLISAITITIITTIIEIPSAILALCSDCKKAMSSKGAFAAYKIRDNLNGSACGSSWGGSEQKHQSSYFQNNANMKIMSGKDSNPPAKYNEKMMMSIWGLYNRYSVHNIKSHNTYENKQ